MTPFPQTRPRWSRRAPTADQPLDTRRSLFATSILRDLDP
jgi:hypothetical protein